MLPAKVRTATSWLWACSVLGTLAVVALAFVPDLTDSGRPPVSQLLAGLVNAGLCGLAAYGLDHRRRYGFLAAYAAVPYSLLLGSLTGEHPWLTFVFCMYLAWLLLHRTSRAYARCVSRTVAAG